MSDDQQPASEPVQPEEAISFAQFLESVSPGQVRKVMTPLTVHAVEQGVPTRFRLGLPEIQLHCPSDTCNGERFFRADDDDNHILFRAGKWNFSYVQYKCANCQKDIRTFALAISVQIDAAEKVTSLHSYKFGELPPYGPPTPSRLISLLGSGRELFLKGRRCEMQGLGIGAFVYYRRVVENQKE
jgi:hypothetical protein